MFDQKGSQGRPNANGTMAETSLHFSKSLGDRVTQIYLIFLLYLMKLAFLVPGYRRNIDNFTGLYRFRDKNGGVNVLVKFHNGKMQISKDPVPNAHVTVTFKDSKSMRTFLLNLKKDILKVILNNEILVTGNLNYLYKFGFMANHPILPLLKLVNKFS